MNPLITSHILKWHDQYGRHDLPWQGSTDPYLIWISEIMLQQTQVATVIPYFQRFVTAFPNVSTLSNADIDTVLHLWTGLGYYARARNLHKTAQIIVNDHHSSFPTNFEDVLALPGIGRSTAGAILAFSQGQHHAILDGNVKRVLSRYYEIDGWYGKKTVADQLWELAQINTPKKRIQQYTQAIMDFGATLCKRSKPQCNTCPLANHCGAFQNNRVNELPQGKPKTVKPTKETTLLLIQNEQKEVLLQRRPPAGIWGGLWCPPETSSSKNKIQLDGLTITIKKKLPRFKHTFSHYHLMITPAIASSEQSKSQINEASDQIWYNLDSPPQVGLAAPVKSLLDQYKAYLK